MANNLAQIINAMKMPGASPLKKAIYPISIETLTAYFNYHLTIELANRGSDYIERESQSRCINYLFKWLLSEKANAGLIIYGSVGVGKSTIMRALRSSLQAYATTIKFWVDEAKSKVSSPGREQMLIQAMDIPVPNLIHVNTITSSIADEDSFCQIKDSPFLIIDDLGVEPSEIKDYGTTRKPFEELMYYRYDNLKTTIVTTNLTPAGIADRYGERVSDRFKEMFNCCGINGDSLR